MNPTFLLSIFVLVFPELTCDLVNGGVAVSLWYVDHRPSCQYPAKLLGHANFSVLIMGVLVSHFCSSLCILDTNSR